MSDIARRINIKDLSPARRKLLFQQLAEKAVRRVEPSQPTPPLQPVPRGGELPLSFAQQRLWFLNQLEPESSSYNIPAVVHLAGWLDAVALEQSLNEVIRRHETLRTTFAAVAGRPVQIIVPTLLTILPVVDLRMCLETSRIAQVQQLADEEAQRPFDLTHGPLMRAILLWLSNKEHVLLLTMHHIISDGWSLEVLVRELATLYQAFIAGSPSPLPELIIQYADFAVWQRQWLQGDILEKQLAYWRGQLDAAPALLELPTDYPRLPVPTFRGDSQSFTLPLSLTEALKEQSRREGVTLFMMLLAAFKALLHCYTGQDDMVVGSPIANRNRDEIENLIGFFVNMLVLRTDLSGEITFQGLLERVHEMTLEAYAHQDLPIEMLVEELRLERDTGRNPLFEVVFVLQNAPLPILELPGLVLSPMATRSTTAKFDLSLAMVDTEQGLRGTFEYRSDLFRAETILRMIEHLAILLETIVANPERQLANLTILTDAERQQLLINWNATWMDYPLDRCIHQIFEEHVDYAPDAVAIIFQNQHLTYLGLDRRANQMGHFLQAHGVQPDCLVGIYMSRSLETMIGILGVLKAGGAYVPLDPAYPKERLAFMLRDTWPLMLLTRAKLAEELAEHEIPLISLDTYWAKITQESDERLVSSVTSDNLAYVIYTSGSTGQPRGVLVPHRGLPNVAQAMVRAFELTPDDRVLQFSSLSFDASVYDILLALGSGAALCLAHEGLLLGWGFNRWLRDVGVTLIPLTVSALAALPSEELATLRVVISGAEPCPAELVARWLEERYFFNVYGPTEATIWVSVAECNDGSQKPTIGRPISNVQAYILGTDLRPVPLGLAGEMCIGGCGVTRGYLNSPKLTAEKFVPDPFSQESGARLYKTGDLARYLSDGNIDFLGRFDHQVKVRGFRIELGEIETILSQHPMIHEAVVVAQGGVSENKRLVAYIVLREKKTLVVSELRSFLQEKLPDYMIPSLFVTLEVFPLTPSGKIDRRALPKPESLSSELRTTYVAPQSRMEQIVAAIWQEVLQVEKIGIHDNFFEIGGHSLLVIQVQNKLQEALDSDLSIVDLFKYPTIGTLAAFLSSESDEHPSSQSSLVIAPSHRAASRQLGVEIAVIGMAGRFPGARDLDEFWQNLRDGVESISFFSDDELKASGVSPAILSDPNYVKARAILADVELFDAQFFGFSPREAESTDPQHRLFLECAWEALESAGYISDKHEGSIGVFASASMNTYLLNNLYPNRAFRESMDFYQASLGNIQDFIPTRVSYKLNLKGPSVNIQTACSSSLVAIHLACKSLLDGECDMVLAGGVSVNIPQKAGYIYREKGIGSPDGHCRAFDAMARGTIQGNGVGIVVLKRLADALADGDSIHAVIKGSAINNDGALKVGYTAPSIDGQAKVIAKALAVAGIGPESISYIEAHGTGTELGDPIEIAALTQAFGSMSQSNGRCAIGSVKTNIGHLDAAAGVAGLIKTVLALKHKQLPPSLNFTEPNPKIDFANSPFYVNAQLQDWKTDGQLHRAGVSSFGIGGTNVHVVLEEAPPVMPMDTEQREHLLLLSAKTEETLEQATKNLAAFLRQHPEESLANVAYTLQMGRRFFPHRRMLVCEDAKGAAATLETVDPKQVFTLFQEPGQRSLFFMFPGQGAQYINMGRGLYENELSFRITVDRCADLLGPHLGFDLLDVLYPNSGEEATATERLNQTALAQPALFVIEYALSKLWQAWGLQPQAMIGHSIGEYAAACLAGVFSLEDALALVTQRGRLIQQLPGGSMLSVPLSEAEIRPLLNDQLSLAAMNGPTLCTISGPDEAINTVLAQLNAKGIECHRLHTSHAFHSAMMEPILEEFAACVGRVVLSQPNIPFVSNVTGRWLTAVEATDPKYWVRHLRQTVRFSDGLQMLLAEINPVLLEVGPGRTLGTLAKRQQAQAVFASLRHPQARQADLPFLLTTLGRLWLTGLEVDWRGFYGEEHPRRIPLPTYPFERKRYWVEPQTLPVKPEAISIEHKKPDIANWFYVPSWKRSEPLDLVELGNLANQKWRWLVFVDECGWGLPLMQQLEYMGHDVIVVKVGEQFARLNERAYTINPHQHDNYEILLQELDTVSWIPQKIVHLWNVTSDDPMQSKPESLGRTLDMGFYSLLFLAQALGRQSGLDSIQIYVITSNLQEVTGEEMLCPEKATLLGPCKVIPEEYSHTSCYNIDIVTPEPGTHQEKKLVEQLLAEFTIESPDPIVAYRGKHRWVQSFEPIRLDAADECPKRLRQKGVYLITGGLGGIGFLLAESLAKKVQARLILASRSGLPPRNEWEKWLSDDVSSSSGWTAQFNDTMNRDTEDEFDFIAHLEERLYDELKITGIESYQGLEESLNQLCASYIYSYFASSGIGTNKGQSCFKDDLKQQLNILPAFAKFYDFMLRTLLEDGIIYLEDEKITFLKDKKDVQNPSVLAQEIKGKYPGFEGLVELLEHCTSHYQEALDGTIESIGVLYPDGSTRFLDESARRTVEHDNTRVNLLVLGEIIPDIVNKSKGKKLRILEVGAGTGGLTRHIAPALQNHDIEYHFTDIGRMFIVNAEKEALRHGLNFMKFGLLDISKAPTEQKYAEHSFDIILGYNVVHAARDIKEAIGNLKKLLTPGGLMCLIEPVKSPRWIDMTWGLTKEWWYFEDTNLRKESPLLSLDRWNEILQKFDFRSVKTYPQDSEKKEKAISGLIVVKQETTVTNKSFSETQRHQTKNKIKKIKELEALGAEVLIVSADVTDQEQMQAVVNQAYERFGQIHGVIHAAGATGGGVIHLEKPDMTSAVLAPKVQGTLVLEEIFSNTSLDFMVLCSSLASIIGRLGLTHYCAANAFLDAFAHYHTAQSSSLTISINWDRWQSVGMAIAVEKRHKELAGEELSGGMLPEEGVDAFHRILTHGLSQVIVSMQDLKMLLTKGGASEVSDVLERQKQAPSSRPTHPRPGLSRPYLASSNEIEQTIAEIWQDILGIEQIGIHDNFFELGGDSLIATQLLTRVRDTFAVKLPMQRFFEKSTIAELALVIAEEQMSSLADEQSLATLLSEVENLPDDELKRLLSE